MSDDYLHLIPSDPRFVPSRQAAEQARAQLATLLPEADEIVAEVYDEINFFDAGENFESIACPRCGAPIDTDWWGAAMDAASEQAFAELDATMPCCSARVSLNDLRYDWPQGFARFALQALNPNVPDLVQSDVDRLSDVVGSPLRKIWTHI